MALGEERETRLEEADKVEITCLMDNYVDRIEPGTEGVIRFPFCKDEKMIPGPIGEHAFSALVTAYKDSKKKCIIFDTGVSKMGVVYNIRILKINLNEIQEIVLSHGHIDHFGGLVSLLKQMDRKGIRVILHQDAFKKRWIILPNGERARLPLLKEGALTKMGVEIVKIRNPYRVGGGLMVATGEIRRQTDFENGFPWSYQEIDGKLEKDFVTYDDQAIITNVKGKGLVILSGCGHAGIVNTVLYSREITGVNKIHAIIGGFHLTGHIFEPVINKTVEAIKEINPEYLIPCHCTGWRAVHAFEKAMPNKFLQNVVGTKYVFS